jgi:hypothetical protein
MDGLLEKKRKLQEQLNECEKVTNDYYKEAKSDFSEDFELHLMTANYYRLHHSIDNLKSVYLFLFLSSLFLFRKKLHNIIMQPKHILRFLQVGRIIRVNDSKQQDLGYGIVTQLPLKASSQSVDTKDSITSPRDASQNHVNLFSLAIINTRVSFLHVNCFFFSLFI